MKTLLMISLMLLSLCPAKGQKVEINGVIYFDKTPEAYLKYRIDSLEKRIVSLEKMVKILYDKHIQDSLYYQRLVKSFYEFPQLDSIVWPSSNDYYIVPLSNVKRKYKVK
jgi:hypothetical protein